MFEEAFVDSIVSILSDIFGKKSTDLMLSTMSEEYSLTMENVPKKIKLFSMILNRIIGTSHIIIEDLIVETTYSKMGINFEPKKGVDFVQRLEDLKHHELVVTPK